MKKFYQNLRCLFLCSLLILTAFACKKDEEQLVDPKPVVEEPILVESVSLDKTKLTLKIGVTEKLTATVLPENAANKNIKWTSSVPAVATVDAEGNIKTLNAGRTTIKVITEDGKKESTCLISVMPNPPAIIDVESITVDTEIKLFEKGMTDIKITVSPKNASNKKFTFKIADESIASFVDNKTIKAIKEGNTTLTLTTEDGAKTATCKIIVEKRKITEGACTDPNGREYKTVVVGNQTWMAENYAYLPKFYKRDDKSMTEARCYVGGYTTNIEDAIKSKEYLLYGAYYNYKAAIEFCPEGWHLATDEEWIELEMFLGMSKEDADAKYVFRGDVAHKLKSISEWKATEAGVDGNGDNESGMNILPAGALKMGFVLFHEEHATYMCDTQFGDKTDSVYSRTFSFEEKGIDRYRCVKDDGFSVRYIKNK